MKKALDSLNNYQSEFLYICIESGRLLWFVFSKEGKEMSTFSIVTDHGSHFRGYMMTELTT